MEWLSLIGIVLAIALFVFFCFKKVKVFVSTIIVSIVVMVLSGLPVLETMTGTYMSGFGKFMTNYLLLFLLSALFGKVMEDSGSVRKIAVCVSDFAKKRRNPQFWAAFSLPVFYCLLSYVGISGFTIIFTVLAIGRDLFKELDVPWWMYPYGSAGIMWAICLGGNIYNTNIIAANGFGTTLFAGMGMSVICFIVYGVVLALLCLHDLNKYKKKGEGFLPSGAPMLEAKMKEASSELPNLLVAVIPLVLPIVLLAAFQVNVLVSMLAAIVACVLLNIKHIHNVKDTVCDGCAAGIMPLVNVCAATGFVSVIQATTGYALAMDALTQLPALASALGLGLIMSAVVASSTSALSPIIGSLVEMYSSAGIGAESAHRLSTMAVCTYMTPHNSGVVNALSLNKLSFAKGAWIYFYTTFIPGVCALAVGILLVLTGIF